MILTIPVGCYLCGAPTQTACDWPQAEKWIAVKVRDLEYDEEIRPIFTPRKGERWFASVTIEDEITGLYARYVRSDRKDKPKIKYPYTWAYALRPTDCQQPACEAHIRELGERTHQCRAHWNSWKEAA